MARDPKPQERVKPVPPKPEGGDEADTDDREGATEGDVGDRTGPGVGYDNEPEQEQDRGGVS